MHTPSLSLVILHHFPKTWLKLALYYISLERCILCNRGWALGPALKVWSFMCNCSFRSMLGACCLGHSATRGILSFFCICDLRRHSMRPTFHKGTRGMISFCSKKTRVVKGNSKAPQIRHIWTGFPAAGAGHLAHWDAAWHFIEARVRPSQCFFI